MQDKSDTENVSNTLRQFYGTYRGFSPTDESPTALGELEINLDEEKLKFKHATGLKVVYDETTPDRFIPMSREQLQEEFKSGFDHIDRYAGFSFDGLRFLFLPDANDNLRMRDRFIKWIFSRWLGLAGDEYGLIIRGNEMADFLGPTVLYNPRQIVRGEYDAAVRRLEKRFGKNCFPKLADGGRISAHKN